jgi:Ca-activated chloride channel family protein
MSSNRESVSTLSLAAPIILVLTVCLLAAFLVVGAAGNTGQITGRVVDLSTGLPLPFATVRVLGTAMGAPTDAHGSFTILNVPPGTYTLRVSFVGYSTVELMEVEVAAGQVVRYDFRMTQSKVDGDTVAVTGKAEVINFNATGIQRTVSADRIATLPVTTNDSELSLEMSLVEQRDQPHVRGGRKALDGAAGSDAAPKVAYQSIQTVDIVDGRFHSEHRSVPPGGIARYGHPFTTEEYNRIYENEFMEVVQNPLSTFSIDVDAGSYSNTRRHLNSNRLPPPDAVRIEELVNYFDYAYPQPDNEHPFAVITEMSTCPWNTQHQLVHIGLQGKQFPPEAMPPSNLVFLLDVSGSMQPENKLPLVKSAFSLLVEELRPQDRVAIVVYAGAAGMVLASTPGSDKEAIRDALNRLHAGGTTAGAAGIRLAYRIASEHFIEGGNNRVILATDGDFNVGTSSTADLLRLIEEKRDSGVFLSVLGFGMGNLKDGRMEQIADVGNGNYAYIDNIREARKVFVTDLTATLYTIAKDVKLQIEFNPALVKAYRLIGYENRVLAKEDFNDDRKDAGELGAGHTVTALYEIVPGRGEFEARRVDSLKYQIQGVSSQALESRESFTVKLRYKDPDASSSKLLVIPVLESTVDFALASDNFRFSAAVAEFGMLLRNSRHMGDASWDQVLRMAKGAMGTDHEGYRHEFINLVRTAQALASLQAAK